MSRTAVQEGDRLTFVAAADHKAGDLVYVKGFYGHCQDDIASGELGMIILNRVWHFARVPSTLAQGTVVSALATEIATTLPILAGATTGYPAFGRVWETGNASMAAIQLFNPRQT